MIRTAAAFVELGAGLLAAGGGLEPTVIDPPALVLG